MTKKMKIISGGILAAAVVAGLAVLKTKDSQTSDEDTEMTERWQNQSAQPSIPTLPLPLRRSNAISDQG